MLPHLLCLIMHPFIPLEHIVLIFPRFPLLSKLSIERWRIEVVEAQVEDSVSQVRRSAYIVSMDVFICLYMIDYIC